MAPTVELPERSELIYPTPTLRTDADTLLVTMMSSAEREVALICPAVVVARVVFPFTVRVP